MSDSLWPHGLQHSRIPCLSLSLGVCSNSCPLSQWCHPTSSSSVAPFSWCLQSSPVLGSFPMSCLSSVQFTQSCPTICNPMNRSTPGLTVHHQLLEFTQSNIHWVDDAIQPSHPLSSPSPPAPNPSQHQGLFQWVNSSHEVAKVSESQLQHQSFQWTPRTDLL